MNWVQFEELFHGLRGMLATLKSMMIARNYRAQFVDTPRRDIYIDGKRMIRVLWEIEVDAKRMRELLEEGLKEDA